MGPRRCDAADPDAAPDERMVTTYRSAVEPDAAGIAEVHVRTWQVAYRGQVPDDYLDSLSVDDRAERWKEILADLEPRAEVLVAEDGGVVVGFASTLKSRDADAAPGTGELAALYVSPARWDHGVGRGLIGLAVEHLGAAGFATATLWVLATNTRARRFYEAGGWSPDGAEQWTHIGGARRATSCAIGSGSRSGRGRPRR